MALSGKACEFDAAIDRKLALANDTSYGLAASIWIKDVDVALRVSRTIKAEALSVNWYSEEDITTPFGGSKESGFGGRGWGL